LSSSRRTIFTGFAPIAAESLYIAARTAMPSDFAAIPYRKFCPPYWPCVADRFG
jgi:microcystin degradation protein MlrC